MPGHAFVQFVLDQLSELPGGVRARAMFGGHGLYCGEYFFGVLAHDRVYFKTDEASRAVYAARGMGPFQINETVALKSYWEVPLEILEQRRLVVEWAQTAVGVAEVSPKPQRSRKKSTKKATTAPRKKKRPGVAPKKKRTRGG